MSRRLVAGRLRGAVALSGVYTLLGALAPSVACAQSDTARSARPAAVPFAIVRVTGTSVRAPDEVRAAHIPLGFSDRATFSMQIDSAPRNVLHAEQTLSEPTGASALATVRIPVEGGEFKQPVIETRPRHRTHWLTMGRLGAELPGEQAERAAVHAHMRRLIETGALFESEPEGGFGVRRTQYADGNGDIALTIHAVRTSRSLRDTTVSGRRALIVRDSTALTVQQSTLIPSRFLQTVAKTRESVQGTIVGVRLVDAETHRTFLMRDTIVMRGTIDSDDGTGATFSSPLFVRSTRESMLHDAFWQAAMPRERFDIVSYTAVRQQPLTISSVDSLLSLLDSARSLRHRDSVRAALVAIGSSDSTRPSSVWQAVRARSLAVGDTVSVIARLIQQVRSGVLTISTADYAMMRPSLVDAATAFRNGVDRELLALDLMDVLMQKPPVLTVATELPSCSPEACAAMRADVQSAQPGLQAVALVAAMVSVPRIWTDSVITYATSNPFLATRAVEFAKGVSSGAAMSAKAPIPEPEAPYEAWRYWLVGRDSSFIQKLLADSTSHAATRRELARPRALNITPQAVTAIRFAEARTGLDYVTALRRQRDTTSADSARVFLNAVLIAMGDRPNTEAELVGMLLGPKGPEHASALAQLTPPGAALRPPIPLASDSIATQLGMRLLDVVLTNIARASSDSGQLSDSLASAEQTANRRPRYVLMHEYPDAFRARASELGLAPVDRDWQLRPGESGYLIELGPIRHRGLFALAELSYTTLFSRGASRSGGYAQGCRFLFVDGPDGWVVAHASCWMT